MRLGLRSNRRRGHAVSKNAAGPMAVPLDAGVPRSQLATAFSDRFFSPARPHRLSVVKIGNSHPPYSHSSGKRSAACSRRADCERRDQRKTIKRGVGFTGAVRRASNGASSLTRLWTTSRRQRFSTASSLEARSEQATERSKSVVSNQFVDAGRRPAAARTSLYGLVPP